MVGSCPRAQGIFRDTGGRRAWYRWPMIRRNDGAWRPAANRPNGMSGSVTLNPCAPGPVPCPYVPPHLERKIAARWKEWEGWVRLQQLRAPHYDPGVASAESARLRQRHSEHVIDMMRAGISMRTIRRHRLDDPRLADEVRSMLVEAAKARQSKASFRRSEEQRKQDRLWTLIRLGPVVGRDSTRGPDSTSPEGDCQPASVVPDRLAVPGVIESIRRQVSEHFYLREMRDPELKLRTHRRVYVLPRQIAMYIARQLTGGSLQDLGRQFGGRHHTTVLHSIGKIEEMRCSDEALNCAITRLMEAVVAKS
jgi:Bacterial dnaA protein helix-turn-helix